MSSIPASAMKHAHVHDDATAEEPSRVAYLTEEARAKAKALNEKAVDGVKKHPTAAIAAGVAAVIGVAAAIAVPVIRSRTAAKPTPAAKRGRAGTKPRTAAKPKTVKAVAKRKPATKRTAKSSN